MRASSNRATLYSQVANVELLRPIHSEEAYERVLGEIDELAPRTNRTPEEDDYLMLLSLLVEQYEATHHAIDTSDLSAFDMLKFLVEEAGMSSSDLGRLLGHRELGSKLLREERKLSKHHISLLSKHFNVSPSLFFSLTEAQ